MNLLGKRAEISQEAITLIFLVLAVIAGFTLSFFVGNFGSEGFKVRTYAKEIALIAGEMATLSEEFDAKVKYVVEPGYKVEIGNGNVVAIHDKKIGRETYYRFRENDVNAVQKDSVIEIERTEEEGGLWEHIG